MLGLSLCQYIGVKIPHKHSGLVTKKTTASFLGIITFISFLIPGLLPLGVSPIIVEKLQLHVTFQLSTFILCALYAALGVEYLQQVKRARQSNNNAVKGMTCVRVRDRNFTRANLMLLACVTLLSLPTRRYIYIYIFFLATKIICSLSTLNCYVQPWFCTLVDGRLLRASPRYRPLWLV